MSAKLTGLQRLVALGLPVPRFSALEFSGDPLRLDAKQLNRALASVGSAPGGYSVRSAASDEDLGSSSGAGRYRSINGLPSGSEIVKAIDAIQRHHREVSPRGSRLGLIIQATHVAACSGVAFIYTDEAGKRRVEVESYFGACAAVTDGLAPPYRFSGANGRLQSSSDHTRGFFRFAAHAQLFRSIPTGCRPGTVLQPVLRDWPRQIRSFTPSSSCELAVYGYREPSPPRRIRDAASRLLALLEQLPPGSHDVEWGASADGDVTLYQWRPMTALPVRVAPHAAVAVPSGTLAGLPAAPGKTSGKIAHASNCGTGEILMLREATVHDVQAIASSRGVVASIGGMLSHVAIICRELGTPCVTGIGEVLPPGTPVEVDGDSGRVKVLTSAPH